MGILSTTGHEKPCGKLGGPSSKAKYHLMTDSEPVPRGKGEKNPGEGSEIEPETVCLQAVRAPLDKASKRDCYLSVIPACPESFLRRSKRLSAKTRSEIPDALRLRE